MTVKQRTKTSAPVSRSAGTKGRYGVIRAKSQGCRKHSGSRVVGAGTTKGWTGTVGESQPVLGMSP